jgi:hypothetical protein
MPSTYKTFPIRALGKVRRCALLSPDFRADVYFRTTYLLLSSIARYGIVYLGTFIVLLSLMQWTSFTLYRRKYGKYVSPLDTNAFHLI